MQIQYSYEHTFVQQTLCAEKPVFEIVLESVRSVQRECPTYTPLYSSSINRLYAQNPVFEIVHGESVIVYLHMYSGNVQQNPLLCVESSCITRAKVFSIFPRFSPTILYRDASSVLLQILAHLCTAVLIGSMRRTLGSKSFVRRA